MADKHLGLLPLPRDEPLHHRQLLEHQSSGYGAGYLGAGYGVVRYWKPLATQHVSFNYDLAAGSSVHDADCKSN